MSVGWRVKVKAGINMLRSAPIVSVAFRRVFPYDDGQDLWGGRYGAILGRALTARLSAEARRRVAAAVLGREEVVVEIERGGTRWRIASGDEIFPSVFATGQYSFDVIQALLGWCERRRPSTTWFLDIGANVGTTTVPLAQASHHVLAIEPVPAAMAMLEHNVFSNGLDDLVTLVPVAIHREAGMKEMALRTGLGLTEIVPGTGDVATDLTTRGLIRVRAVGLDDLVAEHGVDAADVSAVWCDVQGCEGDVIVTGRALWQAGVPLYAEIWPAGLTKQFGLDAFIRAVRDQFSCFITRDELLHSGADAETRPIDQFPTLVSDLARERRFSDVLLIPKTAPSRRPGCGDTD